MSEFIWRKYVMINTVNSLSGGVFFQRIIRCPNIPGNKVLCRPS